MIGAPSADESLASSVTLSLALIFSPDEKVKLATGPNDLTSISFVEVVSCPSPSSTVSDTVNIPGKFQLYSGD